MNCRQLNSADFVNQTGTYWRESRTGFSCILVALLVGLLPISADSPDATLLKVGQLVPALEIRTVDGATISTKEMHGKLLLLNFFATWCPPCLAELPELDKKVWKRFGDKGLVLVAIGREHSTQEISEFKQKKQLDMPMAADPKREIYGTFARSFIPRNFLIGRDGKVIFESQGFEKSDFQKMISLIDAELKK